METAISIKMIQNITEQKKAEDEIKYLDLMLRVIRGINQLIIREKDKSKLLQVACEVLTKIKRYKMVWIGLIEKEKKQILPVAQADTIISNIPENSRYEPWREQTPKWKYIPSVSILLAYKDKLYGVLNVYTDEKEILDGEEVKLLIEVADALAFALKAIEDEKKRKSLENLNQTFKSMVQTVTRILQQWNPYTASHVRGVAHLACLVGQEMGLSEDRIQGLWIGGMLHDIGKVDIPEAILTKPGKLSSGEMVLIRTHPIRGYDILKNIDFPWPVAKIALQHHERLDGSGYPKGITGDKMLLESKILAVCDVVEAMSSHRLYRPDRSWEEVLEEIEKNKGTKYDPQVVEAMLEIIREGNFP